MLARYATGMLVIAWCAWMVNLIVYAHLCLFHINRTNTSPGMTVFFCLVGALSLGVVMALSVPLFSRLRARLF